MTRPTTPAGMPAPGERQDTAAPLVPDRPTLSNLQQAAAGCQACHLWTLGTQTVFGEGRERSPLVLVGEQPGDAEDVEGRPFVGAAGRLLDRALEEAGIDRDRAYVTNVVKHFKWKPRGKRRIHENPNRREVRACFPWLEAELAVVEPDVLVCLGATAAKALFGDDFRVSRERGRLLETPLAPHALATVHPSSVLRARGSESRHEAMARFVDDLRVAVPYIT